MPRLVCEGSHKSLGGAEESGVHLHPRRIVPPSGFGGRSLKEFFVEGTDKEEEPLCGMSCSLLIWMNGCFDLSPMN
jgi:hypothetical protein